TMSGAARAATRSIHGNPNHTAASSAGPSTAADRIRTSRPWNRRLARPAGALAADAAIATFTAPELRNRLLEVLLAEIGPQRVDEHQLGVGALPQQEIADALFAAGANQQVRIAYAGGQQLALEAVFVDLLGRDPAGRDLARQAARGAHD